MSWREKAVPLRKRFPPDTHAALTAALEELIPQPHIPALLVRAVALANSRKNTPPLLNYDLLRLAEMLALLHGPLGPLLERLPYYTEKRSRKQAVTKAINSQPSVADAHHRLNELAAQVLEIPKPATTLSRLPLREGMRYGEWHLWLSADGVGLLAYHKGGGLVVRVWPESNGWYEFHTPSMTKHQVHIVWSAGSTSPQGGSLYLREVKKPPGPRFHLFPGTYPGTEWILTAGKCEILIAHPSTDRLVMLDMHEPIMRCNDAAIPELQAPHWPPETSEVE